MHFSKKIFAQVGIAFSLAFATSVAQAGVVSYTMSGTILWGSDQLHIFGNAPVLDGQRYTQTITTNLTGMENLTGDPAWNFLTNGVNGHRFIGSTTVSGHTYNWSAQANDAFVYMFQGISLGVPNSNDQMGIAITGDNTFTPDGYSLNAVQDVSSTLVPFMSNRDMYQAHTVDPTTPGINSYTFFRLEHNGVVNSFTGRPDSLTWTAAAVPEPETYALMLLGLVGLSLAAKRKKAAVQG